MGSLGLDGYAETIQFFSMLLRPSFGIARLVSFRMCRACSRPAGQYFGGVDSFGQTNIVILLHLYSSIAYVKINRDVGFDISMQVHFRFKTAFCTYSDYL